MEEELPEVGEAVSERKKPKRAVDGHYFNFVEELKSGLHVFRCNKKNSMKCPARLYFNPHINGWASATI
ncbi:hypothetical protein AAVH_17994 [Aphelenchoides avenae]|nr:hypothetical protein AAVH_17994 [Aphelenchus avenae]